MRSHKRTIIKRRVVNDINLVRYRWNFNAAECSFSIFMYSFSSKKKLFHGSVFGHLPLLIQFYPILETQEFNFMEQWPQSSYLPTLLWGQSPHWTSVYLQNLYKDSVYVSKTHMKISDLPPNRKHESVGSAIA